MEENNVVSVKLLQGDCLELMKDIPDENIDLVLTDPPYNIRKNEWDNIPNYIDWCKKWILECQRVLKKNGSLYFFHGNIESIVLICSWVINNTDFVINQLCVWDKGDFRPLSWKNPTDNSNLRTWFSTCEYCLYFVKKDGLCANDCQKAVRRYGINYNLSPIRKYFYEMMKFIGAENTKDISAIVGTRAGEHTFYVSPKKKIMDSIGGCADHCMRYGSCQWEFPTEDTYNNLVNKTNIKEWDKFMAYEDLRQWYLRLSYTHNVYQNHKNIWKTNERNNGKMHQCKKPISILTEIIKTSSNPGDMVLDMFMGSGSTGVACENTGRDFIGIELDEKYFEIAKQRIGGE